MSMSMLEIVKYLNGTDSSEEEKKPTNYKSIWNTTNDEKLNLNLNHHLTLNFFSFALR